MGMEKKCFKCDATKAITEFYEHERMADGHLNKCKECTKKDESAYRKKNIEKVRAYDRDRAKNPDRAKAAAAISKRWRKEDKRRMQCHNAVTRAIRKGIMERKPCCICGSLDSYAHHESYDKPLAVVFYCQPHHKERHKQMVLLGIEP